MDRMVRQRRAKIQVLEYCCAVYGCGGGSELEEAGVKAAHAWQSHTKAACEVHQRGRLDCLR
jgi:hypothetical protein